MLMQIFFCGLEKETLAQKIRVHTPRGVNGKIASEHLTECDDFQQYTLSWSTGMIAEMTPPPLFCGVLRSL